MNHEERVPLSPRPPRRVLTPEQDTRWNALRHTASIGGAVIAGFFAQYGVDTLEEWLRSSYPIEPYLAYDLLIFGAKGLLVESSALGLSEGLHKLISYCKRRNTGALGAPELPITRKLAGAATVLTTGPALGIATDSIQNFALGLVPTQLSTPTKWAVAAVKGTITSLASLGLFRATQHCCPPQKQLLFSAVSTTTPSGKTPISAEFSDAGTPVIRRILP
ncbi:MAG: hypothetical protein K0S08_11 [Gammaproteobacteria bacterium]|nr:hypothetical protein [Gammaproteobacteria bacterium]